MVNYKIAQREHRILARPVLIAVSERLREYQQIYGYSALRGIAWVKDTNSEAAWRGVMSDRNVTIKDRAQPTLLE